MTGVDRAGTTDEPRWPGVDGLRLRISGLGSPTLEVPAVRSLLAEDASGSFGLWPGHADFLTVLGVGVLAWRQAAGAWHYCAVRRGVLTMRRGCEVEVATREAVLGDDLARLDGEVLARLAERQRAEDEARRRSREIEIRALRELVRPAAVRGALPGLAP